LPWEVIAGSRRLLNPTLRDNSPKPVFDGSLPEGKNIEIQPVEDGGKLRLIIWPFERLPEGFSVMTTTGRTAIRAPSWV
jgi:hypothetical protein